ncbi:MAG: nicotinamide riboside transporter PnuC [Gammaproteobacteria bacterium]|nr:nicotinamide mononucleotide transporter [Xanthomonadales bacterium]
METVLYSLKEAFLTQSIAEIVAVITAILYLILAAKENIWCWFFGFVSTAIYVYLFYDVALLSESVLNIYYMAMAVYGWYQWQNINQHQSVKIHKWKVKRHLAIVSVTLLLVYPVGSLMKILGASFPYLDALVALLAVVATFMTARKIFENWYYWLLVDSVSIYLFWSKQMYLTALLFVIYIVLIFFGIVSWKKLWIKQQQ